MEAGGWIVLHSPLHADSLTFLQMLSCLHGLPAGLLTGMLEGESYSFLITHFLIVTSFYVGKESTG